MSSTGSRCLDPHGSLVARDILESRIRRTAPRGSVLAGAIERDEGFSVPPCQTCLHVD
ncbi:hypothetical protein GQ44DRAFT_706101 [Phaeosphaeriaceae sp. PMI808]|nr:hypothetical protein GQ44DRAFT_706101 [Phaeosphaeriaceae sp. PMI808]